MLEYKTQLIANGTVGYTCVGNDNNPPLVMLIGYTGTLFHWNKEFVNELAKKFKIYLLDNRYVGLTKTTNEESIIGMAQDVCQFIEAKGLIKPWVLGWSMGGMITQELASFYAHNLSGMVLLATTPSNLYVNIDFIDFLIQADYKPKDEFKTDLYRFFFSEDKQNGLSYNLKEHALIFANYPYIYTNEARHFQDSVAVIWQGFNQDRYSRINIPTLVLKAKDDLVATKEAQDKIVQWSNHALYLEYNSGGHFLVHKDSIIKAQNIIEFCSRILRLRAE